MSRQLWVIAAALLVLAGTTMKAGPSTDTLYPATVTFSDRGGDMITSDYLTTGKHSYVNGGSDKLETGFHTVTGDLVMRARTGPSARYLSFSLSPITSGAPSGLLNEHDIFMNIREILTMPPGTAKNAIAIFSTSLGELKLPSNPRWIDTSQYASLVYVSRTGNLWTVTADPGTPPGPGDVAAITKTEGNTETLVGLYHTPFQISVSCATCP
jgi:hypothetical protein